VTVIEARIMCITCLALICFIVWATHEYEEYAHKKCIEAAKTRLIGKLIYIPQGEYLWRENCRVTHHRTLHSSFGIITDVIASTAKVNRQPEWSEQPDFDRVVYINDAVTYIVPLAKLERLKFRSAAMGLDMEVIHVV
jgi:hypothetical protein